LHPLESAALSRRTPSADIVVFLIRVVVSAEQGLRHVVSVARKE
jgi:hypothetical protein